MFDKRKETIPGGQHDIRRDGVLKDLQEEISRAVLSQDATGDSSLFARVNEDSYSRDGLRGPIIDEFSEDAYNLHNGPKSKRMDFRDSKDEQHSSARKRSYSPIDDKSSSYRKSREDMPTKRSRSTNSKSGSQRRNDDDDLRNVLKQVQKSKWDDDDASLPDRKRYDEKDYDGKRDRKRNKDSLGVSSSSDMFTMSSQGTLVSLPLEPLNDSRDYFDPGFGGDYRDEDRQKGKKGTYSDSAKDRDSRESRDYSRTSYKSSDQDRRGSLDDGQRGLGNDVDSRDSRYRMDKRDSLNDVDMGLLLDPYGDLPNRGISRDALRDLPLSELAQKSSQKYKTGFELGRPFFGFPSDRKEKEEGWQDPKFGGESKRDSIWKTSSDSLLDQREQSYGDTMDGNNRLMPQDGNEMLKDRLARRSPSSSLSNAKDVQGNSYYKDNKNDNSRQRGSLKTVFQTSKSSTTGTSNFKGSTLTTQKPGPKPLLKSGFLPRQLQKPIGKNLQKAGVDKGMELPSLSRKSGYFPKNMEISSRSRSRSSERVDDKREVESNNSSSKREVRPPSKGKFTTQNWSGLGSNDNREQSKEKDSLPSTQYQGRGRGIRGRGGFAQKPFGRGNMNANNRGRGTAFNPRGRGRGGRGRGVRGRGVGTGYRGRGMNPRGRGFVFRGRGIGRGLPQPSRPPVVGATVRNIFRRSRSLSPIDGNHRKSSRSPGSLRRDRRSRSGRRNERGSRSRSSSFCSTCSSHSCSTCSSWRSISLDSLSGKGDGGKKKHHKSKISSKHEKEKNSSSLDKLKSDIRDMEKQLEQKPVKGVAEKNRDAPKGTLEPKTTKDILKGTRESKTTKEVQKGTREPKTTKEVPKATWEPKTAKEVPKGTWESKTTKEVSKGTREPKSTKEVLKSEIKDEKKAGKTKDKQSSLKDVLVAKEEKGKNSREVKKEVKKKTDTVREVILKSEKRKESSPVTKKVKESPVREVKIVNEMKNKGGKGFDEKAGSKMNIDTLKITIDQPETMSGTKKDKKKDKVEVEEKLLDAGKRWSKSPPGKQKKKEKVKSKKSKKKAKKRKHDRDSGDSGDESMYSNISGQDEFSGYDERPRSLQAPRDQRIVEFSSQGAFDSNIISVHYAKRETAAGHATSRKLSEGEASKAPPNRKNLITIPLPKELSVTQKKIIPQNARGPHPKVQQFNYPVQKGGQGNNNRNTPYSKVSITNESEFGNVDWETAKFAGEFHSESALGDQNFGSSYQENENRNQEWTAEQEEGGNASNYYYEEGTEGEGYEQEYYSNAQEGDWQTGDQGQYQEWYEGEYPQEGAEGEATAGYEGAEGEATVEYEGAEEAGAEYEGAEEAGAEYEGEYYLGEDGLYYPVEGEAYQEYQGEYIEGGTEGEVLDAGQGAAYAEGEYQYQYTEEGGEWQQQEEATAYQTEEVWNQGEVEGQWQEEYQEGYHGAESEWGTEYTQGNEFDAGRQEYVAEGTEMLPQEGHIEGVVYDQQLTPDQYYVESVPSQGEGHHVEDGYQPQPQEEVMEPDYHEEPLASTDDSKEMSVASSEDNLEDNRPLKSILKKTKQVEGNDGKGTKLVSERLAQMRNQSANKVEIPQRNSASVSSVEPVAKQGQNPGQEAAAPAQSEAERYREMEEAILSSQPKDAVGTEYVIRVHGSGTANFFCKLCKCHFNTLTAKNLHIKGMKHIELYIRLKSSLLQSVIKDTKVETPKRPAEDDPSAAQKIPRRF